MFYAPLKKAQEKSKFLPLTMNIVAMEIIMTFGVKGWKSWRI